MVWRKWFVRGVVFTIVGLCAAIAVLYQRFTNPAAVRQQVLAKLQTHFPGATASIDSARLRILGGISVSELRLVRNDDPDKTEILHVPSAVIYHDKQKMPGELCVRKMELLRPRLRAERRADGTWNLQGLTGALQPNLPLPTITIVEGTIVLEDRSTEGDVRSLELTKVELTLVNDPMATVAIEGSAFSDVAGQVRLRGQWQRQSHVVELTITAQQIALAGIGAGRLEKLCPNLAGLQVAGRADLQAALKYRPDESEPLVYSAQFTVTGATLTHPKLPLPLEDVHLTA